MTLIDLSHAIAHGQRVYPHLPAASIVDHLSHEESRSRYAEGTTFQIGKAELIGNLGTSVDAPFHRFAAGPDVAALPLEAIADLDAVVVHVPPDRTTIDADAFESIPVTGRAVLVRTDWSTRWQTPAYVDGHPHLTAAAARLLVDAGVTFFGIDSLNVDDLTDGTRAVHTALLRAGIPIGENLTNLAALPAGRFRFHAVPVKLEGMGSFPVRAYAAVR